MLKNAPLTFHWHDAVGDRQQRAAYWLLAATIMTIVISFYLIFPKDAWVKFDWMHFGGKIITTPEGIIKGMVMPLIWIVVLWVQSTHKKNARLILENSTLSYVSGVPFAAKWLNWTLDLDAIRSEQLTFKVFGVPLGFRPLHSYGLSWSVGYNSLKQVRVAKWHLSDQPAAEPTQPKSFLGFVRWSTPENIAILQQQFDQLPLIHALKQRGITLPALTGKNQQFSAMDLMTFPRMKRAVIGFFISIVAAFGLFHAMRYQHFFVSPQVVNWFVVGALAGVGVLVW
jgi:hypothetical protein